VSFELNSNILSRAMFKWWHLYIRVWWFFAKEIIAKGLSLCLSLLFKVCHCVWTLNFEFVQELSQSLKVWMCNCLSNFEGLCHNPSLGLATKARACKGAGQEWAWESHFMLPKVQENVRGWTSHNPKWVPTLGLGVPMDSQIFRRWLQGSKFIGLKSSLYYWKSFGT
jgi:hypothetical protein